MGTGDQRLLGDPQNVTKIEGVSASCFRALTAKNHVDKHNPTLYDLHTQHALQLNSRPYLFLMS